MSRIPRLAGLLSLLATSTACRSGAEVMPLAQGDSGTAATPRTPPVVTRLGQLGGYPQNLVADEDSAYVTLYAGGGSGQLVRVPLDGGAPATLHSGSIYDLALDATHLYWVESNGTGDNQLLGASKAGGAPFTLAAGPSLSGPLAVAGGTVFATLFPLFQGCDAGATCVSTATVVSIPGGGGPAVPLFAAPSSQSSIDDLAVRAPELFATTSDGHVYRIPLDGGAPASLSFERTSDSRVAADGAHVYWTNAVGDVMREPLDGGAEEVLSLAAVGNDLAVDDQGAYWVEYDDAGAGVLKVLPPGASGALTMVHWTTPVQAIALTPHALVWLDAMGGLWAAGPR